MGPPKPEFALAVGIVGHRSNRLPGNARPTVEKEVARALDAVAKAANDARSRFSDYFAGKDGRLALISGVAEGADTIAANAALARNFALDAVLPFARDEYEKDFADADKFIYRGLLGSANSVFELLGNRADEGRSYEAAGIAILDASDILIAVWDSGASAGRGGTTELVAEAIRRTMPVIHVDANGKTPTMIVWQGLEARQKIWDHFDDTPKAPLDEKIGDVIDAVVEPPGSKHEQEGLWRFLAERRHGWQYWQGFPLLMAAFLVRRPRRSDWRPASPQSLAHSLANSIGAKSELLATAYGWADAVSIYFSQAFRSSFIFNFLFTGVAVWAAAVSLLFKMKWPFAVVELLLIVWVLWNTQRGLRHCWHQRWVEPREVAERLRVALPMTLLGTRPLGPYGEASTWTSWYVRALLRQKGIASGALDGERSRAARTALEDLLVSQSGYQQRTADQLAALNHRLKFAGEVLLSITVIAILFHLVAAWFGDSWHEFARHPRMEEAFIVLSTSLPAIGTAFFGIRTIGDFEGAAKRARRMHAELKDLSEKLAALPNDFHSLRAFSFRTAEVMLGDVASWRLSAESRGLSVPG